MLTDIFAERYSSVPIWRDYGEPERKLLFQMSALAKEFFPIRNEKNVVSDDNRAKWKDLHDRLARELGLTWLFNPGPNPYLSPFSFSPFQSGDYDSICEHFLTAMPEPGHGSLDAFIKKRVSLIELVMRLRHDEIARLNSAFPQALLVAQLQDAKVAQYRKDKAGERSVREFNARMNARFAEQVNELNERLHRAGAPLAYHNGIIQISTDALVERQVAKPFWDLLTHPRWVNVDIDMKEALDQRDARTKDPAFHANRALESTVKIISDEKGWSTGHEKGASNYVDNLISQKKGSFVSNWEGLMIKDYFMNVRNVLGHGPGTKTMVVLTPTQTDWAIETAMIWIRLLVRRM